MRVAFPALMLVISLFFIPRSEKLLRIFSIVLLFILFPDAMTPVGLWKTIPTLQLRFADQPTTLWSLALSPIRLLVFSRYAIGRIGIWIRTLTKFLKDPIIPMSNNEAERTIRQSVLGRKNFYGSRSIDGADVNAIMHTLTVSNSGEKSESANFFKGCLRSSHFDFYND